MIDSGITGFEIVDLECFDAAELLGDGKAVFVEDVDVALRVKDDGMILFNVKSFIFKIF